MIPGAEERASRDAFEAGSAPAFHSGIYAQFRASRKRCFSKGGASKPISFKEIQSGIPKKYKAFKAMTGWPRQAHAR
jgi:hypothetical protein